MFPALCLQAYVHKSVMEELKRIIDDSEITKEDDALWPPPDRVGRQVSAGPPEFQSSRQSASENLAKENKLKGGALGNYRLLNQGFLHLYQGCKACCK